MLSFAQRADWTKDCLSPAAGYQMYQEDPSGCTRRSHPDLWVGVLLNRLREAENLMSLGTGSQLVKKKSG